MASRTVVQFVDDLDGTEIEDGKGGTITFGLDGVDYAIDLSDENADKLRKALDLYVSHASKVGGRKRGGSKASGKASTSEAANIRAWAKGQGYDVPERGRIPKEIKEAYDAR